MKSRSTAIANWLSLVLVVLLGILYFLIWLYPASHEAKEGGVAIITINSVHEWAFSAVLVVSVGGLVVSVIGFKANRRMSKFLLACVSLFPFICCGGFFSDLGAHQDFESIRDRNGAEYHLLISHFMQGSDIVIGRLWDQDVFAKRFVVLARSPWEESLGYLRIVRPAGARRLYLSEKGVLVGVPYENMAFIAYDIETGIQYVQGFEEDKFPDPSRRLIRSLSPFLVLGSTDAPRESDFQTLLDPNGFGRPVLAAVLADVENANPKIQDMARRLAADLRAHPPVDAVQPQH